MANVTRRAHAIAGEIRRVWGDDAVELAPTDRGTDWAVRITAPNAQARDHATALASSVKGVISVDNQLTIEAGKS